ncbi:hypothetical protein ACHHYP_20684 [Achlya hypogyna]|uniref:Uncharacterized protein n=1 Tax=Achlya hypogyna TaxID=1202772 RepID=A0A1V9YEZ9_ACHHY|nr:hypothetical protein ACHHYP_20684 [Achlya hypogyna]
MDTTPTTNHQATEVVGTKRRKATFRFRAGADVDLLKEVINIQPFDAPFGETTSRWGTVAVNLSAIYGEGYVLPKACHTRFGDLVQAFKDQQMDALRASGTDEEYEEREQLLQDIVDLMVEATERRKLEKTQKKMKLDKRESDGEKIRNAAMTSLKRKSTSDEPGITSKEALTKQHRVQDSLSHDIAILRSLDVANALSADELAYNREKLALDAKRLELDREERAARFQLERQEREFLIQALRQIIPKSD